jgi:hypothetical protein
MLIVNVFDDEWDRVLDISHENDVLRKEIDDDDFRSLREEHESIVVCESTYVCWCLQGYLTDHGFGLKVENGEFFEKVQHEVRVPEAFGCAARRALSEFMLSSYVDGYGWVSPAAIGLLENGLPLNVLTETKFK